MEVHQRVVHEKKKPYKCDFDGCDYTAGQKSSLVHHMNWVHQRKKPYACKSHRLIEKFSARVFCGKCPGYPGHNDF